MREKILKAINKNSKLSAEDLSKMLGITEEEVKKNAPCKILATNAMDVLDENLSQRELVVCPDDERWIIVS